MSALKKLIWILILLIILWLIWLLLGYGGGSQTEPGPQPAAKLVFVTSQLFDGNFGGGQLTLGHLAADQRCQEAAESAGRGGTFKAWLSGRVDTGAGPLPHGVVDRFTQSGPYALVSGAKVADDWSDLTDGTLDHAIDQTELGATLSGEDTLRVWTNTKTDGRAWDNSTNCSPGPSPDVGTLSTWSCGPPAWSPGDCQFQSGKFGMADSTTGSWTGTASSNQGCDNRYRLYCFEQ